MKTGVIVYVTGNAEFEHQIDFEHAAQRLSLKADRVEVVSSRGGNYDVMDASTHSKRHEADRPQDC